MRRRRRRRAKTRKQRSPRRQPKSAAAARLHSTLVFCLLAVCCTLCLASLADARSLSPAVASMASSSSSASASTMPRLQCLSCIPELGDTTQLDQFRVRQGLTQPFCDMESVVCAPHQDTCVTVSMQVAPHRFWIGAGCDQRVNYDIPAEHSGCVDLQTFTRSIQPGYAEERRAFQQVCLCGDDFCNAASRARWLLTASAFSIVTFFLTL